MKDTTTEKIKTNLWRYRTCDIKSRLNYVIKQKKSVHRNKRWRGELDSDHSFEYSGAHSMFYWQNTEKYQLNEEQIVFHPFCWLHYFERNELDFIGAYSGSHALAFVWEHVWCAK